MGNLHTIAREDDLPGLRFADRAPLDEVNQEQHDCHNQQDVEHSTQRVAGHEAEEPENQEQENKKQHGWPPVEFS
jgi:hypothetical protein